MRCPNEGKFVSFDTEVEPELNGYDISGTSLAVDVRRVLTCDQCSEELKAADFTVDLELPSECDCDGVGEPQWELEGDPELEPTTRTQTQHRDKRTGKMKPSKPRYWVNFYGVKVTATVKCEGCGREETVEGEEETTGSSMEELV